MKKVIFIMLVLVALTAINGNPTFPGNPFKTEEVNAGVFTKKTDSSTMGSGVFRTKSFNERYPRNRMGY